MNKFRIDKISNKEYLEKVLLKNISLFTLAKKESYSIDISMYAQLAHICVKWQENSEKK